MSRSNEIYDIPFVGLKNGTHEYTYEIGDTFFEESTYAQIQAGQLTAHLSLEKKETMLIGQYTVAGKVTLDCDRCNAPMDLQIQGDMKLIYKFSLHEEDDEMLVVIHPDEHQINVESALYELIMLSLPLRKIHPTGSCDEAMWELIQQYTINANDDEEEGEGEEDDENDDQDDDNPWSILKSLN